MIENQCESNYECVETQSSSGNNNGANECCQITNKTSNLAWSLHRSASARLLRVVESVALMSLLNVRKSPAHQLRSLQQLTLADSQGRDADDWDSPQKDTRKIGWSRLSKDGTNASGLHGSIHQTSDVFKMLGSWAMTVRQL